MVFIWGSKGYADTLGYIIQECPECKTTGVFQVIQARKKFTVYFIPTFSYGQKQILVCTTCQATFEVPKENQQEVANNLMSQEELSSLIERLGNEVVESEEQLQETPTEPPLIGDSEKQEAAEPRRFCRGCGYEVTGRKEAGFRHCPNCGGKLWD